MCFVGSAIPPPAGSQISPSLQALLGFSGGPAAPLGVTRSPNPGLGELQEHPGAELGSGCAVPLLLHTSAVSWQCLLSSQLMRKPSPTACVDHAGGEIASLGPAGEQSCSAFRGVALGECLQLLSPLTQGTDSCFLPSQ